MTARDSAAWRNWAGNQRTDPVRTVAAHDTGDVVDAVKDAARDGLRVKAIGSGHSFTAIAVPDGVAVRAPADPRLLQVDATGLATVPAGHDPAHAQPAAVGARLGAAQPRRHRRADRRGRDRHRHPRHGRRDTGGSPTRCARWSS